MIDFVVLERQAVVLICQYVQTLDHLIT